MSESPLKTLKITAVKDARDAAAQGMRLGFDEGYKAAMLALEAFAEGANNPEARRYMAIAHATLKDMAPQAFVMYGAEIVVVDVPVSGTA